MLWGTTYEIGCGGIHYSALISGTTYPESKIYVCNYGPSGNYLGDPVYTKGTPATTCTNGPSMNYPNLCK